MEVCRFTSRHRRPDIIGLLYLSGFFVEWRLHLLLTAPNECVLFSKLYYVMEKGWSASDFVGQAHCSLLKLYDYLFVPYWIKNIVKRGKSYKICPAFVCGNVQKRGSAELISSEKGEDPMAAWKSMLAHRVPGKKRRLRRSFPPPCGQAVFCYEIYFA